MGFAWMSVIASELISADKGLGYFIEVNRVLLRPDRVIAAMLIIGVIGFVLYKLIVLIEKKLTAWRDVQNV
jgi:ABC-type nitrate/sulfonate/bicarbonate transport system permease component